MMYKTRVNRSTLAVPQTGWILIIVALFGLAACERKAVTEPVFEASPTIPDEKTRAVVMVHADWCPSCRAMAPMLKTLEADAQVETTAFVTLDFTDRNKAAFFTHADLAGIGMPVRKRFARGISTGILLVINLQDQKIVREFDKNSPYETVLAAISTEPATVAAK